MANPQPNIWHAPMPLICSSFEPGHLDSAIEAMPDSDYRTIALAEAAYFRGKADEACRLAEPFLTSSILPLRISSCFICGFANLSLDHAHAARACLLNLASSKSTSTMNTATENVPPIYYSRRHRASYCT